jgi:hypothetical protein
VDPYFLATAYAGLADRDNVMRQLGLAYERRSAQLPPADVEPCFDPIRSDARFQDLVARMGFPRSRTAARSVTP